MFTRREFLKTSAGAGAAITMSPRLFAEDAPAKRNPLPRWRGFNLLDFFQAMNRNYQSAGIVPEDDLRWIRDWGFDFVRIPMDYWLWIDSDWRETRKLTPEDTMRIDEAFLEKVDRTVELGNQYGLHVCLNFHRAPGYCINNPEREPFVLWTDSRAEEAFVRHWDLFAHRYSGVSSDKLSFNLVNEAPRVKEGYMSREDYVRVMTAATETIRKHSPDRTIIIDGLSVGNEVVEEMIPTGVAQAVHGYSPGGISHYHAPWVDKDLSFPTPTWPLMNKNGSVQWDRERLEKHYAPWGDLVCQGIGVHCGEAGCYNKTPYDVFLAWMGDVLDILKGHGIGWALWNLRGSFGLVDSGRTDCQYEDWRGHRLDRQLLQLLQQS